LGGWNLTKIARGEIGRLDYITTQFLQAMRPTPPRLALALLNDAVHDVVELMQPEVENRQMFVELDLRQDLMLAYFDMEQIKQVLLNLVKNAIQVMPSGGQLTLRTRQNVHWVWVSIGDTGPGMSQAQLKSLFTPFFTTREEGSGLGLMVVQRIIRAHRGRIEVESQEGQGTEFRVFLPLQEQGPQLLNPASSEPPESEEEEL
jgi:signal transduction histidine kinase